MPKSKKAESFDVVASDKKEYQYNYICQKSMQTLIDIDYKEGMKTIYSPHADEVIELLEDNLIKIKK